MNDQLALAAEWLATSRKTIAFTGAGVSTESGIPDFRSAGGLWSRYDPAEYATLGAFLRNPEQVWKMLAELEEVLNAEPNPGHRAMAELEAAGALAGIITQNVDGLHQAGGSKTVVEYHGSGRTFSCLTCRASYTRAEVKQMERPPRCTNTVRGGACAAILKPDVVFFDEPIPPQAIARSAQLMQGAELVLVVGTSCEVYPASEIPLRVRGQGGRIIEINLEPAAGLAPHISLLGRFSEIMPALKSRWEGMRA
ncbi:MAG: NAD-dependent deacylase [SAR324 cluster bacterium]|nr:NAD-dependent deacylase [SAR324 cluster bacterium]